MTTKRILADVASRNAITRRLRCTNRVMAVSNDCALFGVVNFRNVWKCTSSRVNAARPALTAILGVVHSPQPSPVHFPQTQKLSNPIPNLNPTAPMLTLTLVITTNIYYYQVFFIQFIQLSRDVPWGKMAARRSRAMKWVSVFERRWLQLSSSSMYSRPRVIIRFHYVLVVRRDLFSENNEFVQTQLNRQKQWQVAQNCHFTSK